jgi:hypothetical protein
MSLCAMVVAMTPGSLVTNAATKAGKTTTKAPKKAPKGKLPAPDAKLACTFMLIKVSDALGADPVLEISGPAMTGMWPRGAECTFKVGETVGGMGIRVYAQPTEYGKRLGRCDNPAYKTTDGGALVDELELPNDDPLNRAANGCAWAKGAVYTASLSGPLASTDAVEAILSMLIQLDLAKLTLPYLNSYKG